jgi:hypothetical protein
LVVCVFNPSTWEAKQGNYKPKMSVNSMMKVQVPKKENTTGQNKTHKLDIKRSRNEKGL